MSSNIYRSNGYSNYPKYPLQNTFYKVKEQPAADSLSPKPTNRTAIVKSGSDQNLQKTFQQLTSLNSNYLKATFENQPKEKKTVFKVKAAPFIMENRVMKPIEASKSVAEVALKTEHVVQPTIENAAPVDQKAEAKVSTAAFVEELKEAIFGKMFQLIGAKKTQTEKKEDKVPPVITIQEEVAKPISESTSKVSNILETIFDKVFDTVTAKKTQTDVKTEEAVKPIIQKKATVSAVFGSILENVFDAIAAKKKPHVEKDSTALPLVAAKEEVKASALDQLLSSQGKARKPRRKEKEEIINPTEDPQVKISSLNTEIAKTVNPLDFKPIPYSEITRQYISYPVHHIDFGTDYTKLVYKKAWTTISEQHGYKRMEMFKKLCEFIVQNKENLAGYRLIKANNPVKNQFKATMSCLPQPLAPNVPELVDAHISIIPNLPMEKNHQFLFVTGGNFEFKGSKVKLQNMLNLTDRVDKELNNLDALCEAALRINVMELLQDVLDEKKTPLEASLAFGSKFRQTVRYIGLSCSKVPSKDPLVKQGIAEIEYCELKSYSSHVYSDSLKKNPSSDKYTVGMISGISKWVEENSKKI